MVDQVVQSAGAIGEVVKLCTAFTNEADADEKEYMQIDHMLGSAWHDETRKLYDSLGEEVTASVLRMHRLLNDMTTEYGKYGQAATHTTGDTQSQLKNVTAALSPK